MLSTVDFAEVTALEDEERWQQIGELLADAARGVERAGADFLLLCTTTFHKVADQVEAAVDIPLLHLADVVAEEVRAAGRDRRSASSAPRSRCRTASSPTGWRGTASRPSSPTPRHHEMLNSAIYDELVHGRVVDATRRRVLGVIEELWDAGAGGVLLGCTELELLIKQADCRAPGLSRARRCT